MLPFVGAILQESERLLERKYLPKLSIDELVVTVARKLDLFPEVICSGGRQRRISTAKSLVAFLAVEKVGYSIAEVSRYLGMRSASAFHAVKKGKRLSEKLRISLETQ